MSELTDICDHLESEGVGGATTGWEVYAGVMPADPDQVIAVMELPGGTMEVDPEATNQYDYPRFQVAVRGPVDDYETCRAKLKECRDALHDATIAGFVYCFVEDYPNPMGHDANRRHVIALKINTMRTRD